MTNGDAGAVARRCLEAWTGGDFETLRSVLADDVSFLGPLGETQGADAYVEGIRGFAGLVDRAQIHEVIVDGDQVVLIYDLVTPQASLPSAGWYRIRAGKV
ncbi:MAG: nuclear transport factor 2 family protein, partial [Sphingomonas sp.]